MNRSTRPTEAELEILSILWEKGPCTVRDVHESLNHQKPTGYTTALKFLQIMAQKGLVRRDESNRAHVYEAASSRDDTERGILSDLVDRLFQGSSANLVVQALSTRKATPEELDRIRKMLDDYQEDEDMNLLDVLSPTAVAALGDTLVHFLWQGALLALLYMCCSALLRRASSQARYLAACVTMLLMLASPIVTWFALQSPYPSAVAIAGLAADASEVARPARGDDSALVDTGESIAQPTHADALPSRTIPVVVLLWFGGVAVCSLRLGVGWLRIQSLKRGATEPVPKRVRARFKSLCERLQVRTRVDLRHAVRVHVPTVAGWIRPTILLPTSALFGLTEDQLETILLHELAHVRRHDYLVNLLQAVVETLLFYHPAVWWVSHRIRVERENCCDDLVVSLNPDRELYARALERLETARVALPAAAATGGRLPDRIARILGTTSSPSRFERLAPGLLPLAVAVALVFAMAPASAAPESARQELRDLYFGHSYDLGYRKGLELVEQYPDDAELLTWHILNAAEGDYEPYDTLLARARRSVAIDEKSPWSWAALAAALNSAEMFVVRSGGPKKSGVVMREMGEAKGLALEASQRAVNLDGGHPDIVWLRAKTLLRYPPGDDAWSGGPAIGFILQRKDRLGNPPELLNLLADAYFPGRKWGGDRYLKDVERASKIFEQVREAHPDNVNAWYLHGKGYLGVGMMDKALPLLEKAVELNPGSLPIRRTLWRGIRRNEDLPPEERKQRLVSEMKAFMNDYEGPEALLSAMVSYHYLKDWDSKRSTIEELISKYPDSPQAGEGRYQLIELRMRELYTAAKENYPQDDIRTTRRRVRGDSVYRQMLVDFINHPSHADHYMLGQAWQDYLRVLLDDPAPDVDQVLRAARQTIALSGKDDQIAYNLHYTAAMALARDANYLAEAEQLVEDGLKVAAEFQNLTRPAGMPDAEWQEARKDLLLEYGPSRLLLEARDQIRLKQKGLR